MADVSGERRRFGDGGDRDRGQLILVAGLTIAVTLVALVLLLNTVIYTQNLATRGPQVEDSDAIAFRAEVVTGVGEVMDAENRAEYETQAAVTENVTEGIERYDDLASSYRAERATITAVNESSTSYTNGTLLRQTNASRSFTSAGGANNWTLVEDAADGTSPGVRNVTLTVSRENLSGSSSSAFRVRLDGDVTDEWHAHVYENGGEITVAVKNGSETDEHDVCSVSGSEATIDLTAGTINGTGCPGLVWANGIDAPYDVAFENGSAATGTYALTVDEPPTDADLNDGHFAGPTDAASPRAIPAVYAAEFEIHFETPNLAFHTTVRVAPGEPR